MKYPSAIVLIALIGLAPAGYALAQGNVLLPSDNPDKSNYPNLGLTPAEPAPAAETLKPASPPPAETPKPVAQPAAPKAAPLIAQPNPATPAAHPYSPPPLRQPYQPPVPVQPYSLSVSLTSGSTLTPNDVNTIGDQLGIAKASVASECRLSIGGMLITDQGTASIENRGTASVTAGYGGTITNAILTTYATCNSAPKPSPYSYAQRVGDKFSIPVGSAFCAPKSAPGGSFRQVTVTHTANGTDSCVYQ